MTSNLVHILLILYFIIVIIIIHLNKKKEVYLLLPRFNQQSTNGSTLSEMERKCSSNCNRRRTRVVPEETKDLCIHIWNIFHISPDRDLRRMRRQPFSPRDLPGSFFSPSKLFIIFQQPAHQMMMMMVRRTCWMEFSPNCALPGSVERDELRTRWNGTESLSPGGGQGRAALGTVKGMQKIRNP